MSVVLILEYMTLNPKNNVQIYDEWRTDLKVNNKLLSVPERKDCVSLCRFAKTVCRSSVSHYLWRCCPEKLWYMTWGHSLLPPSSSALWSNHHPCLLPLQKVVLPQPLTKFPRSDLEKVREMTGKLHWFLRCTFNQLLKHQTHFSLQTLKSEWGNTAEEEHAFVVRE